LPGELVGDAVVVPVDLDVIVDVDCGQFPVGELVGPFRQRPQRGLVQLFKEAEPGPIQLLEWALVEPLQTLPDAAIGLGHAVEDLVAQVGQNPAFDHLDPSFNFGFVTGLAAPGRQDDALIVRRHLLVGAVELWFVPMRPDHTGLEVVWD
jgi:hypothetical protein